MQRVRGDLWFHAGNVLLEMSIVPLHGRIRRNGRHVNSACLHAGFLRTARHPERDALGEMTSVSKIYLAWTPTTGFTSGAIRSPNTSRIDDLARWGTPGRPQVKRKSASVSEFGPDRGGDRNLLHQKKIPVMAHLFIHAGVLTAEPAIGPIDSVTISTRAT